MKGQDSPDDEECPQEQEAQNDVDVELSLSTGSNSNRPQPQHQVRVIIRRRSTAEPIEPPYPWATSKRAVVCGLDELLSKNIKIVSGDVACRNCKQKYRIEYDLEKKFSEVREFVMENRWYMYRNKMRDRAPKRWNCPVPLNCNLCGFEKCVMPVIEKKRNTNWLFLLLGEMIGHCGLHYLKYFCKHSGIQRTGAKDRLLYLTYLGLCKQLDPHTHF